MRVHNYLAGVCFSQMSVTLAEAAVRISGMSLIASCPARRELTLRVNEESFLQKMCPTVTSALT